MHLQRILELFQCETGTERQEWNPLGMYTDQPGKLIDSHLWHRLDRVSKRLYVLFECSIEDTAAQSNGS